MLERTPTIRAQQGGEGVLVTTEDGRIRRLMIEELEELQGLPRGWTCVPGATDTARRRLIGNGMAVPVMRWIAERIGVVHALEVKHAGKDYRGYC